MNELEILGALFLILMVNAYPELLNKPKQDMRRYGAIDTPSWLNPPDNLG